MKAFVLSCFLFLSLVSSAQNTFKVDDDVNFFDGLNWIESKIIKVGENGKYLVYTNREKTKTVWCTAEDLDPMYKESVTVEQTTIRLTETHYEYIYHPTDIVRYFKDNAYVMGEVKNVYPNGQLEIYTDSTKTLSSMFEEKDVEILKSQFNAEYRTVEKKVTYTYRVNEEVDYFENTIWIRGVISKINDQGQVMIDGKWMGADNLRKKKQ